MCADKSLQTMNSLPRSNNLQWQVVDRPQLLPTQHQDHDLPGYGVQEDEFPEPSQALSAGNNTDIALPSAVQFLCFTPFSKETS